MQGAEVNIGDRGIQLTRPARAAKIWLSLKTFGTSRSARRSTARSTSASWPRRESNAPTTLELLSPATLGIVCFRRCGPGGEASVAGAERGAVSARLNASGLAHLSSTRLEGRYALRLCLEGRRTRPDDVERVLSLARDGVVAQAVRSGCR